MKLGSLVLLLHALRTAVSLPHGFGMNTLTLNGDETSPPTDMRWIDDTRALVLFRQGVIKIMTPYARGNPSKQYMYLQGIYASDETGALSLALDPDWGQGSKYVYVYWGTREICVRKKKKKVCSGGAMRISRFQHIENGGGLSSRGFFSTEQVLWKDSDGYGGKPQWHYGGSLQFGPEQHLYLTLGDKYESVWIASHTHNSGCIIRITKTGGIPHGNLPSWKKPAACWAHGLRNGYKSWWDLPTDRYIIAEVGGNNNCVSMEDIHLGGQGKDFGWPKCEGNCKNKNFPQCKCGKHDDPIFTYPHRIGQGACTSAAVIGGPVMRNSHWPLKYQGAYFYGDFVRGDIKFLEFETEGGRKVKASHSFVNVGKPVLMTTDPRGALWICTILGDGKFGMTNIDYFTNKPPTMIEASASTLDGDGPLPVTFTGIAIDYDTKALQYEWHFGDGKTSQSKKVKHVYYESGSYTAVLYVDDGKTTIASAPIGITVGRAPEIEIVSPAAGSMFSAGDIITMVGAGTYQTSMNTPPTKLPDSAFSWSVRFVHGTHTHTLGDVRVGSSSLSYSVPRQGHGHKADTGLLLSLTATSPSSGLTTIVKVSMHPIIVQIPFTSSPQGIVISIDGASHITPFVLETTPNFLHTMVMPDCHHSLGFKYVLESITGPWHRNSNILKVPDKNQPVDIRMFVDGSPCLEGSGWQPEQSQKNTVLALAPFRSTAETVCTVVPEFSAGTLACPPFSVVTGVRFASFGAAQGQCGAFEIKDCHSPSSIERVAQACVGLSKCTLSATDSFFGNDVFCTADPLEAFRGYEYKPVNPGKSGYCRGTDKSGGANTILFKGTVEEMNACQHRCDNQKACTGFEWVSGKSLCELHSMTLTHIKSKKKVDCYAKHSIIVKERQPLTLSVAAECTSLTTVTTFTSTTATRSTTTASTTTASTTTATVTTKTVTTATSTTSTTTTTVSSTTTTSQTTFTETSSTSTTTLLRVPTEMVLSFEVRSDNPFQRCSSLPCPCQDSSTFECSGFTVHNSTACVSKANCSLRNDAATHLENITKKLVTDFLTPISSQFWSSPSVVVAMRGGSGNAPERTRSFHRRERSRRSPAATTTITPSTPHGFRAGAFSGDGAILHVSSSGRDTGSGSGSGEDDDAYNVNPAAGIFPAQVIEEARVTTSTTTTTTVPTTTTSSQRLPYCHDLVDTSELCSLLTSSDCNTSDVATACPSLCRGDNPCMYAWHIDVVITFVRFEDAEAVFGTALLSSDTVVGRIAHAFKIEANVFIENQLDGFFEVRVNEIKPTTTTATATSSTASSTTAPSSTTNSRTTTTTTTTTTATASTTTATTTTSTAETAAIHVEFAWKLYPSLPSGGIGEVASAILDDCIYAVGEADPATYKYNLTRGRFGRWETVAARPYAGNHHAMVTYNDRIFILGGLAKGGSKVQSFNPKSNRWSVQYPPIPYAKRVGSVSAVVLGGEIKVCGGLVTLDNWLAPGNTLGCASLNPSTGVWTLFASMLVGINHQAAGTDGKKMYIFGGRTTRYNRPENGITTVQIYDPTADAWSYGPEMLYGRSGMGNAPFINGRFFVFGGEEKETTFSNENRVFNQVHSFNPTTFKWSSSVPHMPIAAHGVYPVADDKRGLVYSIGGGVKMGASQSGYFQTLRIGTEKAALQSSCTYEPGFDFYGHDLKQGMVAGNTADDCCHVCKARGDCTHFTFIWGSCFLKSSSAGRTPSVHGIAGTCNPDVVGAPPPLPPPPPTMPPQQKQCTFDTGADYFGFDLIKGVDGNANDSVECSASCIARDDCTHFTFIWNLCFLKSSDEGRAANRNGISGACYRIPASQSLMSQQHPPDAVIRSQHNDFTAADINSAATSSSVEPSRSSTKQGARQILAADSTRSTSTDWGSGCTNVINDDDCNKWAKLSYCEAYSKFRPFMKQKCQMSCRFCKSDSLRRRRRQLLQLQHQHQR